MNIKEILESNGVEAEKVSALEMAINKAVGVEFVAKDRYDAKLTEISGLKTELQNSKDDNTTNGDYKKKYNDEVSAHNATKASVAAEKEAADIDGKVAVKLKEAGMNEKVIDKALKLYDRSKVKKDKDGNIDDADKLIETFKADWADFFGETKQQGADVGNNYKNNTNVKNPWLKENRSLAEQTRIARENPALAIQLAKAAGINLNL